MYTVTVSNAGPRPLLHPQPGPDSSSGSANTLVTMQPRAAQGSPCAHKPNSHHLTQPAPRGLSSSIRVTMILSIVLTWSHTSTSAAL